MTNLTIQIFSRRTLRGKRWFFRVRAANGKTIAQSEGYHNRADCLGTATLLRARLFDAVIQAPE